jgi:hypothetical protein
VHVCCGAWLFYFPSRDKVVVLKKIIAIFFIPEVTKLRIIFFIFDTQTTGLGHLMSAVEWF